MDMLLAPGALCFGAVHEMARPRTAAQLAKEQQQQRSATTRQAKDSAKRVLAKKKKIVPEGLMINENDAIVLGVPIEGTLAQWIKNRFFCLPFESLILHAVVVGASGTGKSETLLRLAVAAAKVLKWQVVFVDAKGDYHNAAKFLVAMQDAGVTNVKMFPREYYNGWQGTRDALISRLLAIDNVAEVTNAGQQHYQSITENLVEMAVNAPGGPPQSSQEFLDRLMLKNGKLYDMYEGYHEQQSYLFNLLERPQEALGTYSHYRAFFTKLHGKLDGTWSYDDCDAAYILLNGLALPEVVNGLGRFLLADFANYATRKPWSRRTLFVFDEIGSLNVPIFKVFEQVRFHNISVMVSSQDPRGLAHRAGAWDEVKRVLGNAAIKIVHRSEDAEEVLHRAGTVLVAEQDYRSDASGMVAGGGTTRMREMPKIDPNEVLRLEKGETFVISEGEYERARVALLDVDSERIEHVYLELERQSKEELPPLMKRQPGGQQIVDAIPSASSPPQQQSATTKQTSNAPLGMPAAQKTNDKSSSSKQGGGKSAPSSHTQAPRPFLSSSMRKSVPDVDETSLFMLPDGADQIQQLPTQPGVLPLWDPDEDLLK